MKKYIFITANIHIIGGAQLYIAGKAKFLRKNGWDISIIYASKKSNKSAIEFFREFNEGGFSELRLPPYMWSKSRRKKIISDLVRYIGDCWEGQQIIIESNADSTSQWGELLAAEIHAKHVCFITREKFRGKNTYFEEKLDFYDFKHRRRELCTITPESMKMLFEGYKKLNEEELYSFIATNEGPVQDVYNPILEKVSNEEWNICYIGRCNKIYVDNIINDVAIFAKKHSDKQIQFIFVGDTSCKKKHIQKAFKEITNVKLTELGDLVPIPRDLFTKVDVVIAGAGCAVCSVREGVLTIVADANNGMSNGLLGYETNSTLWSNGKQDDFANALERVLVEHIYEDMKYNLVKRKEGYEKIYEQHLNFVTDSMGTIEHYDVEKLCASKNYRDNFIARVKWYIVNF